MLLAVMFGSRGHPNINLKIYLAPHTTINWWSVPLKQLQQGPSFNIFCRQHERRGSVEDDLKDNEQFRLFLDIWLVSIMCNFTGSDSILAILHFAENT